MTLLEHVAQRIRDLRTTYAGEGLSQEALGVALGVATNTISRWETGTYKPALEDLDKMARFFNVSVLEFFPAPEKESASQEVAALLRAAAKLSKEDLQELRRYAEFRQARPLYKRSSAGRKSKEP